MTIRYMSGLVGKIVLDQGFGAWTVPHQIRVRHDFSAPAPVQAKHMFDGNYVLERRGVGKTYLVCSRADPGLNK